jgi:hypothetical protein
MMSKSITRKRSIMVFDDTARRHESGRPQSAWHGTPMGTPGDGYAYEAIGTLTFWPKDAHERLLALRPELAEQVGETWDEHRERTEVGLVQITRNGLAAGYTLADGAEFAAFADGYRRKDILDAYAKASSNAMNIQTWPPARNAACWCGSGRKYKQCCRPYGLGSC